MSIFSCKACKAKNEHIKSLEAQIDYLKKQMEPISTTTELPDMTDVPVIEPNYIPVENKQRDFTADNLLINEY